MRPSQQRPPIWATHYIVAADGYGTVHLVSDYKGEEAVFIDGQLPSKRRAEMEKLLYKESPDTIAVYAAMTPYDANQHTLDAYIARA